MPILKRPEKKSTTKTIGFTDISAQGFPQINENPRKTKALIVNKNGVNVIVLYCFKYFCI